MPGLFGWLNTNGNPGNTSAIEVQRRLSEGEQLYLLDVREPDEYRDAHVPDSVLVPLGQLAYKISDLPRDRPIVALCQTGSRSSVAISMLRRAGFTNVENMHGGMVSWARSGGPMKRGR